MTGYIHEPDHVGFWSAFDDDIESETYSGVLTRSLVCINAGSAVLMIHVSLPASMPAGKTASAAAGLE